MAVALGNSELSFRRLFPKVVRLGTPAVMENLLGSAMLLADALMLARLPNNELYLAATGLTAIVLWRSESIAGATQIGTGAFISRRWGEEKFSEAGRALAHAAVMAFLIGIVVAIVLFFSREGIFSVLGGSPEVVAAAASYFAIVLFAFPARLIQIHLTTGMRAAGDTRTPLLLMIAMVTLNVFLNWAFIFGNWGAPRMEMNGAAVATTLSYYAVFGIAALVLFKGLRPQRLVAANRGMPVPLETDSALPHDGDLQTVDCGEHDGMLKFSREGFRVWLGQPTRRIFRVTGPTYIEEIAYTIGILSYIKLIALFGTTVLAAHNVVLRIESLSFTIGIGIMVATSTMVGQALGAKDTALAKRMFGLNSTISAILMGIAGLLMVTAPDLFLDAFAAEQGVRDVGRAIMYIIGAEQVLMAIAMVFVGGLKGAGATIGPLMTQMAGVFLLRLGVGYVLALHTPLGLYGIYLATALDWLVRCVILYLFYRRGKWMTVDV